MFQRGVQTRVGTEFRVLLKSNKDSSPLGSLVCFYNTVFPLLLDSGVSLGEGSIFSLIYWLRLRKNLLSALERARRAQQFGRAWAAELK